MANETMPVPVNISLDEDWKEASEGGSKRESTFNEKNYLNVRLEKGEKEKKLRIRLLPMDPKGGSPFVHVHFHNVEVNKDLVKPGMKPFKSFLCLNPKHNPDIDHEKFGNKCPFCEQNRIAYDLAQKATSPVEKKVLIEKSLANKPKEAIIVRCIERGKEDEGVKFWKFNLKFDNTDPYHKILDLAKTRAEEGRQVGQEINILDLYTGRDLNLTIKPGNTENQTVIDIIESSVSTPVASSQEQLMEWLNDSKKWQDVFTPKPYEYLCLIQDGKYPWFDRELGKWVDKADIDAKKADEKSEKQEEVKEADKQVENSIASMMTTATATSETQVVEDLPEGGESDDELPF